MTIKRTILYYVYSSPALDNGFPDDHSQFGIYTDMYELVKTIYKRKETYIFHIFTNPKDGYWSPKYYGQIVKDVSLLPKREPENVTIKRSEYKNPKDSFLSPFYKKNGIEVTDK